MKNSFFLVCCILFSILVFVGFMTNILVHEEKLSDNLRTTVVVDYVIGVLVAGLLGLAIGTQLVKRIESPVLKARNAVDAALAEVARIGHDDLDELSWHDPDRLKSLTQWWDELCEIRDEFDEPNRVFSSTDLARIEARALELMQLVQRTTAESLERQWSEAEDGDDEDDSG